MSSWTRFNALPLSERMKLVLYAGLLAAIHLGLAGLGFRRLYAFLGSISRSRPVFPGSESQACSQANHTAELVSIAARHGVYPATCLRQSLLTWWLLRRKGILAELRIGVQSQNGQIYAHAWVQHGNEVISEGALVETNFSAFEGLLPG